jgi:diacylglycerol kinase family enzyme
LIRQIKAAGFDCRYSSTKEDSWKKLEPGFDLLAIAGGDGTVRKVLRQLLKKKDKELSAPIAVLPLGTANNIAKTLNLQKPTAEIIASWKQPQIKPVDIGLVKNIPDVKFFLEGLGFGIFPYLMKEMKKAGKVYPSPQEELKGALKKLHTILSSYKARQCKLTVDGTDHSGKFFMVEVMNIKSIGPNMLLAPDADPGDGEFEIVLVPEAHQEKFAEFILQDLIGGEDAYHFHTLKGKDINIQWDGVRVHADDQMLKLPKQAAIDISLKAAAFEFIVMEDEPAGR